VSFLITIKAKIKMEGHKKKDQKKKWEKIALRLSFFHSFNLPCMIM
jgi:hypothetical protein